MVVRHGFGYLLAQSGLGARLGPLWRWRRPAAEGVGGSRGERLRLLFEALGPTFVKLGQLLSTRADLLPPDVVAELGRLQDRVPAVPFDQVRRVLEEELGDWEARFSRFDREPLASASIGQVHRAILADGTPVAVKVQRPGAAAQIETDLEILVDAAQIAARHSSWATYYDLPSLVGELARALRQELDYRHEGRNADRLRAHLPPGSWLTIPRVHWDCTTSRILAIEYLEGQKLADVAAWSPAIPPETLALHLAEGLLRQILLDGDFHADPHPGNLLVLPGGRIGLLDFGLVGRLAEGQREELIALVLSLLRGRDREIVRALHRLGALPEGVDRAALEAEVARLRREYLQEPLRRFDLSRAIADLMGIAFRYRIRFPSEYSLMGRALVTLEGVVQQLAPGVSLVEVAEPIGRELLRERLAPERLARRAGEAIWEAAVALGRIPGQFEGILDQIDRNQLRLRLGTEEVNRLLGRLDRVSNRLSFSIVLLSFSIVMAGLAIGSALLSGPGQSPFFVRLPVLEIGFGTASLMALGLVISILRSGRF